MQVELASITEVGDFHITIDCSTHLGIQCISLDLDKDIAIDDLCQFLTLWRNPECIETAEFIIDILKVNCPSGECPNIFSLDGPLPSFINTVVCLCKELVTSFNHRINLHILSGNR